MLNRRKRLRGIVTALLLGGVGWACLALLAHRHAGQAKLDQALYAAADASDSARVQALLAQGADPNASEVVDPAYLPSGPVEYVRGLFRPRAGVGSFQGMTALMAAARRADLASVQALIKAGAAPNLQDYRGASALMYACGGKGSDKDGTEESAIIARKLPLREILRILLDSGADPNARTYDGSRPLKILSLWTDRTDCAELLLQRGAQLDDPDDLGVTALYCALNGRQKRMVGYLLDRGARVDAYDREPLAAPINTCLAQAFQSDDPTFVVPLLERGAKFSPKDPDGPGAAIVWAVHFDDKILRALLARYANPHHNVRVNGLTALQTARQQGSHSAVALLKKHGYIE